MGKKLFINCLDRETRVALKEDGKLVEFLIERPIEKRLVGNIYKGKVANVLPGMQAAFVDIGIGKNAFLYVDDIYPSKGVHKQEGEVPPTIKEMVREGETVLVQVSKEPFGNKGARVTTNIALPGRYLVFLPFSSHIGISRRILADDERTRLKVIAEELVQGTEGLIIRTMCEGISEQELRQDIDQLREKWKLIQEQSMKTTRVELIYQEVDMISKLVRDLMTPEIEEYIIDDRNQYLRLKQELQDFPDLRDRLQLYTRTQNIFDYYEISTDLDKLLRRKVWLKNGGYLIIDQTEALTVIDVNTGKYTGNQNLEETVSRTNIEAAKEIARQIRLRDIGGIIIIDFIDMSHPENQLAVLEEFKKALQSDRTKTNVVGITAIGLVEMTRKKSRQNVLEVLSRSCSYCDGNGYTLSEESVAAQIERTLIEYRQQEIEAVLIQLHPQVMSIFMENNRSELQVLEHRCGFRIFLYGNERSHLQDYRVAYMGNLDEAKRQLEKLTS